MTENLGASDQFSLSPVIGEIEEGHSDRFAFSIEDNQIRSTRDGIVYVRAIIERYRSRFVAATPTISGMQPIARSVDGDRTVALFAIDHADLSALEIRGASATDAGQYRLQLDLVGDINNDGKVDGIDSQLLAQAMGTFVGQLGFNAKADFNADGAITVSDSQLLAANYGLTSSSPTFALNQAFTTDAARAIVIPDPGTGQPPIPETPVDPSVGNNDRLQLPAADTVIVQPPQTVAMPLAPTAGATFGLRNGNFDQAGESWSTIGTVTFDTAAAQLFENGTRRSSLRQAFYVPDDSSELRLIVSGLTLNSTVKHAPDAFEIALLDATTLLPLAGVVAAADSDSLLNIRSDGTYLAAPGVVVGDANGADPSSDLGGVVAVDGFGRYLVQIDVSSIPAGTLAVLSMDLLGFGDTDSTVSIDEVGLVQGGAKIPVAEADIIVTSEDVPVNFDLLANDQTATAAFDLASLQIVVPPSHGEVYLSRETGLVTYAPQADYSGSDSFTYTIRDAAGFVSNEAFVSVDVQAVTDVPVLELQKASGSQDTPLALTIDARSADTDGSETFYVRVDALPTGAILNHGRRISAGVYELTENDLTGLTLLPSSGWSGETQLNVTVVASDSAASEAVTESAMTVEVGRTIVDPMSIVAYEINRGETQRSYIHTLSVTFNQDAWIADPMSDIMIRDTDGNDTLIAPKRFDYDADTATLTIDVEGLLTDDSQYYLMMRRVGIASDANRLQTMANGPEVASEFLPLPFHQLLGDVNGNNEVDQDDWDDINQSFNSTSSSDRYVRYRDLSGDGRIDRYDFIKWRNQYPSTTDHQAPQVIAAVTLPDQRLPLVNAYQRDSNLSLVVNDVSEIASLKATIDGSPAVELVSHLSGEQALQMPLADLYAMASRSLDEADHELVFVASDRWGNESEPFVVDFAIDVTAPATPITPVLIDSDGNEVTSPVVGDSLLTIRSEGDSDSILRLYQDGGSEVGLGIASNAVDFQVDLGSLADGTYKFSATAEDPTGNRSGSSGELSVTIDRTAPSFAQLQLAPASDTGTVGDRTTDLAQVDVVGITEPGAIVRAVDGMLETVADVNGAFELGSLPLGFGTNQIDLTVSDAIGNTHAQSLTLFRPRLESDAPRLALTLTEDLGRYFNDKVTSSMAFAGAVDDASAISHLWMTVTSTSRATQTTQRFDPVDLVSSISGATFSISTAQIEAALGQSVPDGDVTISLVAVDEYENASARQSVTLKLDRTAPIANDVLRLDPQSDLGRDDSDGITRLTNLGINVMLAEPGLLTVFVDGAAWETFDLPIGENSVTVTGLSEGTHQLTASLADLAGNVGSSSATLDVSLDTTVPSQLDAEIQLPGAGVDVGAVRGNTDPNATVYLYRGLDSQTAIATTIAATDGSYRFDSVRFANGINRFRVVAEDLAGNSIEQTRSIRFDAPDLSAPQIALSLAQDTGAFADDLLTRVPDIEGRVDDASRITTFQISVQQGPFVNALGTLEDNRFYLSRSVLETALDASLLDGEVTVRVRAVDQWGHASAIESLVFQLDTARPSTPATLRLDSSADTGVQGDGVTSQTALVFTTTVADSDAEVLLFADGIDVYRANAIGEVTLQASSETGRHRFVAQAVDLAGNASFYTAPQFVTVDDRFTKPTVSLAARFRRDDLGGPLFTSTQVVDLVGSAEPGTRLEITGTPHFADANEFGMFAIENVELAVGANSLSVDATDVAGNAATVNLEVILVDEDGPAIEMNLVNDTGASDSDGRTNDPAIIGTLTDASSIVVVTGSLNQFPAIDLTPSLNQDLLSLDVGALESMVGQALPDGRYELLLHATDSLGNESDATLKFSLDRTAPPVPTPVDLLTSSDHGRDARDNITNEPQPVVRQFAERGSLVTFFVDGVEIGSTYSTGVAQYALPEMSSGTYQVTGTIEDLAGNIAETSEPLELTIDLEGPSEIGLQLREDFQSSVRPTHTLDQDVVLVGHADPGSNVTINGQNDLIVDASGTFEISVQLQPGENPFEMIAEDLAGNQITQTLIVTLGQLLPPAFTFDVADKGPLIAPTIAGQLRSESPIAVAQVSTDPTFASQVVDLTDQINGGSFVLDATDWEVIHGAPFLDGTHKLYFRAVDDAGRSSETVMVPWERNQFASATLVSEVVSVAGQYRYRYTATGAEQISRRLDEVPIPIPANADLIDWAVPPGWHFEVEPDNLLARMIADNGNGLGPGEELSFSFTSSASPDRLLVSMQMSDLADGDSVASVTIFAQTPGSVAPGDDSGRSAADFYSIDASQVLAVDEANGLLGNDAAGINTVTQAPLRTRWGADVAVESDGSFVLVPGQAFVGLAEGEIAVDSFEYTARNAASELVKSTVFIRVTGENQSPIAFDDIQPNELASLGVRATRTLVINPSDLLANDVDPDVNDLLSISAINGVSSRGASVTLVDGNYVYDPTSVPAFASLAAGETLIDRVTYTLRDPSGLTSTAIAEIVVTSSQNLAPVAIDHLAEITEDGEAFSTDVANLLDGATDPDALPGDQALQTVATSVQSSLGATVQIFADGTFVYDSNGVAAIESLKVGDVSSDSFQFAVSDGIDDSPFQTMTLLIHGQNDAPSVVDDQYFGVAADGVLTVDPGTGLLANDSDFDSPLPLIIDPSQTDALSSLGATVTLRPDGTFDYDPVGVFDALAAGETVVDSFTYVVLDDRGAESIGLVEIEVVGVDDAPVSGTDGIERGYWAVASQKITVDAANGLLINDSDPDQVDGQSTLLASFDGFSQYGARVIVNADGSFSYDPTVSAALAQFKAEGIDVVDTFTYSVSDSPSTAPLASANAVSSGAESSSLEASSEGVVEIIVRSGPSSYSFDLVGKDYDRIGEGVSINNHGAVSFSATQADKDNLYVWTRESGIATLIPDSLTFGDSSISTPPRGEFDETPMMRFSDTVQINDQNSVYAQRQMNARGMLGIVALGAPLMEFTDLALTYSELWNADRILSGSPGESSTGVRPTLPRQVGVGDMGLANSGLRWGDPTMTDFVFLEMLAVLPPIIGAATTIQTTMVPRVWTINPSWASAYFTPVNPVWNAFQHPDAVDINVLQSVAIVTSLAPIYTDQIYVTPFVSIRPETSSVNNRGETVFLAETNDSEVDPGLNLVTYSRERAKPYVNVPISQPIDNIHLSDNGWAAYVENGEVKAVSIEGEVKRFGFEAIGNDVSISDTGVIAVLANGPLGRGIYAIDAESGLWVKVVGESGDGVLDSNEIDIDGSDVGSIASLLEGPIGINGSLAVSEDSGGSGGDQSGENSSGLSQTPTTTSEPPGGAPYFTVAFMAADSEGKQGLHSARFAFPTDQSGGTVPIPFFHGHGKVVDLGELLPGIGPVNEIHGFDIVNNSGQVAFSTGDKVVRATPPVYANGEVIYALEGRRLGENSTYARDGGAAVATFVAGDPKATASQFIARVDFGDGTVINGEIRSIGGARYEVVAEHSYDREGPYAITVQITDTVHDNGGLATTLANIINVKSEENLEKLSETDSDGNPVMPSVQSFATPLTESDQDSSGQSGQGGGGGGSDSPTSLGLRTVVSIDRAAGTYEVLSLGTAAFSYNFVYETAGSDGQGEPNASQRGDGSGVNVRKVISRGTLDGVNFAPGSFSVATYETAFDGEVEASGTSSSNSYAQNATTTTNFVGQFVDEKTWDGGVFDWTLRTHKDTEYVTSGERLVDGDLISQVDALIGGGGSSYIGSFVMSGNQSVDETLREFGTQAMATRDFLVETESQTNHTGGRQSFDFTDASDATSVFHSFGTVSDSGDYSLAITSTVSTQIVERRQNNGPQSTVTTGGTTSTTTTQKAGNLQSGNFTLLQQVETQSDQVVRQENQGESKVSTLGHHAESTLSGGGNDETGVFNFVLASETESINETVLTNSVDVDYRSESTMSDLVESRVEQSGNLYDGSYQYDETFTHEAQSFVTSSNGPSRIETDSTSTTTGEKRTVGDKKSGEFRLTQQANSVGQSTTVTRNQTTESETVAESESNSESEKSGNLKQGQYEFSGYSFGTTSSTQLATNTGANGTVETTNQTESRLMESVYSGTGDSISGRVEKQEEGSTTIESDTVVTNQTKRSESRSVTQSERASQSVSNTLLGTTQSVVDEVSQSESTAIETNQDRVSESNIQTRSTAVSESEGNRFTGESTSRTAQTAEVNSSSRESILGKTVQQLGITTTRQVTSQSANQFSGVIESQSISSSESTSQSTTTSLSAIAFAVSIGQTQAETSVVGNQIVGDRSGITTTQSDRRSLDVAMAGVQASEVTQDTVWPTDVGSEFKTLADGLSVVVQAGVQIYSDDQSQTVSRVQSNSTSESTSNEIDGVYESETTQSIDQQSRSYRTHQASISESTQSSNRVSSTIASGNTITGDSSTNSTESAESNSQSVSTNQGQTRDQQSESESIIVSSQSGNSITGLFTSESATTATSETTTLSLNQTLSQSSVATNQSTTTNQSNSNRITGETTSTQRSETASRSSSETVNQTQATNQSNDSLTTAIVQSTGNTNTGEFSESRSATSEYTRTLDQTNGSRSKTLAEEAESTVTSTSDGNSISGAYRSTENLSQTLETAQTETAQTLEIVSSSVARVSTETTRSGNQLLGDYAESWTTIHETNESQDVTNQSRTNQLASESTAETTGETSGNQWTGDYTRRETIDSDSARTESTTNGPMSVESSVEIETVNTTDVSGNTVTGTTRSVTTFSETLSQSDTSTIEDEINQISIVDRSSGITIRHANAITGLYSVDSQNEVETQRTTRSENQTQLTLNSTEVVTDQSIVETGNEIVGGFDRVTETETSAETDETTTNQTSALTILATENMTSQELLGGNAVTGQRSGSSTSTTSNSTARTFENQSLLVVAGIDEIVTVRASFTGNSVEGTSQSTTENSGQRVRSESITNGTLNSQASETSIFASLATRSENALSGVYQETIEGSQSSTLEGDDVNKSLSVEYTLEQSSSYTNASSGNNVVGNFTSDSASQKQVTKRTLSTNGPLAVESTLVTTEQTHETLTGNSVAGTSSSTLAIDTISVLTQTDANQSLSVDITANSSSRTEATSTNDQYRGEFSTESVTTSTSDRVESLSNQGFLATHSSSTESNNTREASGNTITGASISNESGESTEVVDASSEIETEAVEENSATTRTWQSVRSGNDITGVYASESTSDSATTSSQQSGNQTLAITANATASSHTTTSQSGNDITGDYSRESSTESVSTGESNDVNQTRVVDSAYTGTSETTSTESGNLISGTYTLNETQSATSSSSESNQIGPNSTNQSTQSTTSNVVTTGDYVTGAFESTSTTSVASTFVETFDYLDLSASKTSSSTSETERESAGNEIAGTQSLSSHSESSSAGTSTENNQSLVLVDTTFTSSVIVDSTSISNSVTGVYESDSTSVSTDSWSETSQNQTLSHDSSGSSVEESTSHRGGNSVTGQFTATMSGVSESTQQVTTRNQTLTTTVQATTESESTATSVGNEITGAMTSETDSSSGSTSEQTDVNQTQTVVSTIAATSSSAETESLNAITGVYQSNATSQSISVLTEARTNQTLTESLQQTTQSTTNSTASGNQVTGDYSTDQTTNASTESVGEIVNQSNRLTTIGQTETLAVTSSETGNSRFQTYSVESNSLQTIQLSQSSVNQSLTTSSSSSSTTETESVRSGNSVSGEFSEDITRSSTSTSSGESSNQTLASDNSSDDAFDEVFRQIGNDITGLYTSNSTVTSTSSVTTNETNTDHDVTSVSSQSRSVESQRSGNSVTGDLTETTSATDSVSLDQTGTIGDRTFTLEESNSTQVQTSSEGNQITTEMTSASDSDSVYEYSKQVTYSDGTDSKTVTQTNESTTTEERNAITGLYRTTTESSGVTDVAETGTRTETYTATVHTESESLSTDVGNRVTGDYLISSSGEVTSTTRRDLIDGDDNELAIVETFVSDSSSDSEGNQITGVFESHQELSSEAVVTQSVVSTDGLFDEVTVNATNSSSLVDSDGNSVTGAMQSQATTTVSQTLTQDGVVSGSQVDYDASSNITQTSSSDGNSVTGVFEYVSDATEGYAFTQVIDRGVGDSYTLVGAGTKTSHSVTEENGLTGAMSNTTSGRDVYELTETGASANGVYETHLTGADDFTEAESVNSQTGVFERRTELIGQTTGTQTIGGVANNIDEVIDQVVTHEGNYIDGDIDLSVSGTGRYHLLVDYAETSNAGTGVPGDLDHSPTGAPLTFGNAPAVPTGGGAESLGGVSTVAIQSSASAAQGSMAAANFRGIQASAAGSVPIGSAWSGSAIVDNFSQAGVNAAQQFCFPAGTEVLMADGSAKPIEQVDVGDRVASRAARTEGIAAAIESGEAAAVLHSELVDGEVSEVYQNSTEVLVRICLDANNSAEAETIRTTAGHPFFVIDPDATESTWSGKWVLADKLKPGDQLISASGDSLTISNVATESATDLPVYNFCVRRHHNYHVRLPGTDRFVLVHNDSFGMFTYGSALVPVLQEAYQSSGLSNIVDMTNAMIDAVVTPLRPILDPVMAGAEIVAGQVQPYLEGFGEYTAQTIKAISDYANQAIVATGNQFTMLGAESTGQWLVGVGLDGLENETLFGVRATTVAAGVTVLAAVTVTIATGGMAGVPIALGIIAGAADAYIQGELSGEPAGYWQLMIGAGFGGIAPTGAFVSLAGGVAGVAVSHANGWDLANGYTLGSMMGGFFGTGAAAYARKAATAGRGAALGYAATAMAVEASGAAAGFAYGMSTGRDFRTSLQYAFYGQMVTGIAGALTVKCFVAGTPVYVPLESDVLVPAAEQLAYEQPVWTGWSRIIVLATNTILLATLLRNGEPESSDPRKRRQSFSFELIDDIHS
ncbi:hypothetical protein C2E31_12345 [Rhodopirellula baltica]|nr:hypothetical protein C2E31_12345 [Rhodopirellula baltica]